MITYSKGCGGLFILLRLSGTSWPHGIFPGLLSASIGIVLSNVESWDDVISDDTQFVANPYPYQLFAYLVGFVLVFRTNFGYQRYWEALDAMQRMGSKWLDAALMTIAFDAKGNAASPFLQTSVVVGEDKMEVERRTAEVAETALNLHRDKKEEGPNGLDHQAFFVEITHLFSLMHALALQHLRNDSDLDNIEATTTDRVVRVSHLGSSPHLTSAKAKVSSLGKHTSPINISPLRLKVIGGLGEQERQVLFCDSAGAPLPPLARVTMVESWIMRRFIARQKYEPAGDLCKTPPPITSRLVQNVSDGNLAFSQACKSAETPFPFPYQNMIRVFLWMFALTSPFIINAKILQVHARAIVNVIVVWAYFSLAEVSDNLEDPYVPYDPNELPLESMHYHFNARLLSMGVVPKARAKGAIKLEN